MRFGNSSLTHVRRVCYNFSRRRVAIARRTSWGVARSWCVGRFRRPRRDLRPRSARHGSSADELQDSVSQFTHVLAIVQQDYAVPVDTDHALYDGAIPGMLRVLDPHSTFFDPRAYALLREDQRGKYYGVGMTVGSAGQSHCGARAHAGLAGDRRPGFAPAT